MSSGAFAARPQPRLRERERESIACPLRLSSGLRRSRVASWLLKRCARRLDKASVDGQAIAAIRTEILNTAQSVRSRFNLEIACLVSILCDLRGQGWRFRVRAGELVAIQPVVARGADERKAQVRSAHLVERDLQLQLPGVQRLLNEMERPRLVGGEWRSVFSLMRDGRELAEALRSASDIPEGSQRLAALRNSIDPYVQVIRSQDRCEFTGLRLLDVWRYFRHTWSTSYNSTPGRTMHILVRDRAAKNHPVVGIAALGSSIVQMAARDSWIGWTSDAVLTEMRSAPTLRWARWLSTSLSRLVGSIKTDDLCRHLRINKKSLSSPTAHLIERLEQLAARERGRHEGLPQRRRHKTASLGEKADWKDLAETHLFVAKRAATLAQLLKARRTLTDAGFVGSASVRKLRALLEARDGPRVVGLILRHMRALHVGVDMMDITVCGSVEPYSAVLGGKLVALLTTSSEVASAYAERYGHSASIIASCMAGRAVRRRPKLVLLGTTSLYDVASSQYNRLQIPATGSAGSEGTAVRFALVGATQGYGSYHFSSSTMRLLETMMARRRSGRRVNSIFGEGVSPKLRKVRMSLDALGLPANSLLQHGSRRLIYMIALATNFREVLLSLADEPSYILPPSDRTAAHISDYWMERWLQRRIEREDALERVRKHTLVRPIQHGARVLRLENGFD
jgi:hypothetical protein